MVVVVVVVLTYELLPLRLVRGSVSGDLAILEITGSGVVCSL